MLIVIYAHKMRKNERLSNVKNCDKIQGDFIWIE